VIPDSVVSLGKKPLPWYCYFLSYLLRPCGKTQQQKNAPTYSESFHLCYLLGHRSSVTDSSYTMERRSSSPVPQLTMPGGDARRSTNNAQLPVVHVDCLTFDLCEGIPAS
jgi:hypothetical protein